MSVCKKQYKKKTNFCHGFVNSLILYWSVELRQINLLCFLSFAESGMIGASYCYC